MTPSPPPGECRFTSFWDRFVRSFLRGVRGWTVETAVAIWKSPAAAMAVSAVATGVAYVLWRTGALGAATEALQVARELCGTAIRELLLVVFTTTYTPAAPFCIPSAPLELPVLHRNAAGHPGHAEPSCFTTPIFAPCFRLPSAGFAVGAPGAAYTVASAAPGALEQLFISITKAPFGALEGPTPLRLTPFYAREPAVPLPYSRGAGATNPH